MKPADVLRAALPGFERRSSLESPSTPLSVNALIHGGYGAGAEVSESTALGLTAYLRAISLISSSVAELPIRVYYRDTRTRVTSRTVLDSPSDTQTPFEFWQTWMMHQLTWGNAFGLKVRDGAGVVRRVKQIHPSRVTVRETDAGKVFSITGDDGVLREWDSFDIAHLPWLSPNGLTGLSPLQACSAVLSSAIGANKATDEFLKNGSRLSGVLESPNVLTEPQADRVKAGWRQKYMGSDKAGEVAVLDSGLTFKAITLPPEDAQLLQTRSFSVSEIGRMFGIPSHFLNDQEKATAWGSGIESMGLGYVIYTLGPRTTAVQQRITRELLPGGWDDGGWEARIDLKGLLRGDSAGRSALYRALMDMKVINNHQIAALEDMDPPEGDPCYVMPANYALVDVASDRVFSLSNGEARGVSPLDLSFMAQRIYLAVTAGVLSVDDARKIMNMGGADLPVGAPPPVPPVPGNAMGFSGSTQ